MRSRRLLLLGIATLILLGAGIAVAATRDDGGDERADAPLAVDQQTTTSSTEPTTTTIATATSVSPSTTVARTSTTVRRTTTTARATTTTVAGSTTTVKGAGPTCIPAEIEVKIVTDQPSYAPGREVKITSTLRNKSSATCFYNGYSASTSFRDDLGHTFPGVAVIADSFRDVPLAAGQTVTHNASWDHRACAEPGCGPLPAGPYYVTVSWNFGTAKYDVLTSFILTG